MRLSARMRKKNVNRPGVNVVDTVLVPCKPPKGLLTNICVCAVDASVVVRVAVVRAILVRTFMVSLMESAAASAFRGLNRNVVRSEDEMSTWLQSLTHGSNGGPASAVAAILSVYSGNEEVCSETKGAGVDRSVIPRCTFNLYGQPAVALTNLGDVGFPQRLLVGFGRLNFAEDGEQRKALDEKENYMQYIAIAVAM